jgi:hypothetical protein
MIKDFYDFYDDYVTIPKIGDIVSKTGTDRQVVIDIDNVFGTVTTKVIVQDITYENDTPIFDIGDEETLLTDRYTFIKRKEEI